METRVPNEIFIPLFKPDDFSEIFPKCDLAEKIFEFCRRALGAVIRWVRSAGMFGRPFLDDKLNGNNNFVFEQQFFVLLCYV